MPGFIAIPCTALILVLLLQSLREMWQSQESSGGHWGLKFKRKTQPVGYWATFGTVILGALLLVLALLERLQAP